MIQKIQPRLIIVLILVLALTLLIYLSLAFFIESRKYQNEINLSFQQLLGSQNEQISNINHTLSLLVAENESVSQRLAEEAALRIEAEAKSAASSAQLSKIQDELDASSSSQTSSIVSSWSKRVAKVSCWTETATTITSSDGSAVLFSDSKGGIEIVTNNHVLRDSNNTLLKECEISFPGSNRDEYELDLANLKTNGDDDWVMASIISPDSSLLNRLNSGSSLCSNIPSIGDPVVILGYPSIGSNESITVTEGIISGKETDFYITNAKVEVGNSGGAAILAKQNCYLGTPTFTAKGRLESLARILKQELIFQ